MHSTQRISVVFPGARHKIAQARALPQVPLLQHLLHQQTVQVSTHWVVHN